MFISRYPTLRLLSANDESELVPATVCVFDDEGVWREGDLGGFPHSGSLSPSILRPCGEQQVAVLVEATDASPARRCARVLGFGFVVVGSPAKFQVG